MTTPCFHKTYFVKLALVILVIIFSFGSVLTLHAQTVDTADIGMDANTTAQQTIQTGKEIFNVISENVLEPLALQMMGKIIDKMNTSIVNWVSSGFDGNPFYVDDPKQFFTNLSLDAASNIAGGIRTNLNNLNNCDPGEVDCDSFESKNTQRAVLFALGRSAFSGASDGLQTNNDTLKAFENLLGNSNESGQSVLEAFQSDFKLGGLRGYEAVLLDENATPIGKYMNTLSAISNNINADTQAVENAGTTLSDTSCKPGATRDITDKNGEVLSTYCLQYEVNTPYGFIDSQLQESIASGFSKIQTQSQNPYAQLATAALESLVGGVLSSGLSQVNSLATNTLSNVLSGTGGTAPTSQSVFQEVTNVEGELDSSLFSPLAESTYSNYSNFDVDAFIYGTYAVFEDDVFGENFTMLDSGSIVFSNTPGREIATAEIFTGNVITIAGVTMSYENPNNFRLVRIATDENNIFPLDYYYIDEEGLIIKGEKKDDANVFTPRFEDGALERFDSVNIAMNQQRITISRFPEIAMNVDQHCVLGPDLGFEQRFNKYYQRETQKHERKAENEKDKWADSLTGTDYARSFFLNLVSEKMTQDLPTLQSIQLRDEILGYNNLVQELTQRSSALNSARAQVATLIDKYLDPDISGTEKEKIFQDLARLDQQRSVPSLSEVERERQNAERIANAELEFGKRYNQCFDRIKEAANEDGINDNYEIKHKVVHDVAQTLYCPFEQIADIFDYPGIDETFQAGYIFDNGTVDAFYDDIDEARNYGALLASPLYSFLPQWLRSYGADADVTELYFNAKDGNEKRPIHIKCDQFYRSSITDYLPFMFSTY